MQTPITLNDVILECEHVPQSENENNSTNINELVVNENMTELNKNTRNSESQVMRLDTFDLEILPEVPLDALEKKTVIMMHIYERNGIPNDFLY